jgi:hypothetical protein
MKSLAHKDWPYTGTPNEWRGFVKDNRKQIPVGIKDGECGAGNRQSVYQKQNFGPELP